MIDRVCQKTGAIQDFSMIIVELFRGGFQKWSLLVPV